MVLARVETRRQERELIDVAEAERHLALNGIGPQDPVILCAYGQTNRFVPERQGDAPYDWEAVTDKAALGARDYVVLRGHLINPDGKTPNVGYISCPGGTATKKRPEIKEGRVLIAEIDQEGLDKDFQAGVWLKANLPEPTYQLDTGGKSIHNVWVLDRMVCADLIREGRARLSQAIEDATGLQTDHAMHSPNQPSRLAGGIHPKTGKRSVLINVTGKRYGFEEVMAVCPVKEQKKAVASSGGLFRADDPGDVMRPGEYPTPSELSQPVPITLAIRKKSLERINTGQQEDQRPVRAFYLSREAQEAKAQIVELGYKVAASPSVEDLFDSFCRNSDWLGIGRGEQDLEDLRARHCATPDDVGEGYFSKSALRRAIAKWAEDTRQWRWKPASLGSGKGFCSKADAVSAKKADRKELPLQEKLALFERYLDHSLWRHRNPFRRLVFLRAVLKELDLTSLVKPTDLPERVVAAMSKRVGGVYQVLTASARKALVMPQVEWLVPGVIPANDLTFFGGRPKVGKTLLVIYLIRCLLNGESWLGFPSTDQKHTVILVTDDQGDADTASMLKRQGLWDHERLLWSSKFRLDEQQLDLLLDDIKANPGAVVVVDSLRSISRGLTSNENDAALGVLLYDLKGAVMAAGGTLVMIHHASKTSNEVGVEALSGHSSIPGAGNSVVTLHYLMAKDGKTAQKTIPERRLFREGRSGAEASDLVVSIDPAGGFRRVMMFEEHLNQLEGSNREIRLQKEGSLIQDALGKLLERREKGLEAVSTLELLKLAGRCGQSVRIKAELASDANHKQLERRLKHYEKQGVIQCDVLRGGFSGAATQQVWSLTDSGAMEVRSALG
jgi:hypothetical protein